MSKEKIGLTLKKYRELNNITVKNIAERLNKSVKTIYAWENGMGQPDIETLIELCRIYNINDFEVFAETPVLNKKEFNISVDDKNLLMEYHTLDTYGRNAVDSILNIELKRTKEQSTNSNNIVEIPKTENEETPEIVFYESARDTYGTKDKYNTDLTSENIKKLKKLVKDAKGGEFDDEYEN